MKVQGWKSKDDKRKRKRDTKKTPETGDSKVEVQVKM